MKHSLFFEQMEFADRNLGRPSFELMPPTKPIDLAGECRADDRKLNGAFC